MSTFLHFWLNYDDFEPDVKLRHHLVSEEYLDRHKEDLDWDEVCRTQYISMSFILDHIGYIVSLESLLTRQLHREIYYSFDWEEEHSPVQYPKQSSWTSISLDPGLTEEFIESNSERLDWDALSMNDVIFGFSEGFLDKHLEKLYLSKKIILPMGIIHRHFKYLVQKYPNHLAASYRINSIISKIQRRFIERIYNPSSSFVNKKCIEFNSKI